MDYDAYVPDSSRALKSAKAYRMLGHDYATYYQYAIYVRVPLSPPLHTPHPVDAWPSDNISPREGQLCGFFCFFFLWRPRVRRVRRRGRRHREATGRAGSAMDAPRVDR